MTSPNINVLVEKVNTSVRAPPINGPRNSLHVIEQGNYSMLWAGRKGRGEGSG